MAMSAQRLRLAAPENCELLLVHDGKLGDVVVRRARELAGCRRA